MEGYLRVGIGRSLFSFKICTGFYLNFTQACGKTTLAREVELLTGGHWALPPFHPWIARASSVNSRRRAGNCQTSPTFSTSPLKFSLKREEGPLGGFSGELGLSGRFARAAVGARHLVTR